MRRYVAFAFAVGIILLCAACAPNTPAEEPTTVPTTIPPTIVATQATTTTVPTTAVNVSANTLKPVDTPPLALRVPGAITVYQMRERGDIFEPYGQEVAAADTLFLLDIVTAVEKQMAVSIPVLGITQQKGMVVVDLAESFIADNTKLKVAQILNTLAATFQQNHLTFEWIQYRLNSEVGVFGERWETPPLKLLESESPEVFAALRAQIPYEGLQRYAAVPALVPTDATGQKIADYMALVRIIDKDITSPQQLEGYQVLQALMLVTQYHTTTSYGQERYTPALKPLEAPAAELLDMGEDCFYLKEHVEESARLLFGDDFTFKHESFNGYMYLEPLGVYTPPHRGGGYNVIPVVLSYTDLGDSYRAEIVYLTQGMGGYASPAPRDSEEFWVEVAEKDIPDFIQNTAERREVVLKKAADGRLVLVSHRFL